MKFLMMLAAMILSANSASAFLSFPDTGTYTYENAVISFIEENSDYTKVRATRVKTCGDKRVFVAYDFESDTRLSGVFVTSNGSKTLTGTDVKVTMVDMDTSGSLSSIKKKIDCDKL